MRVSVIYDNEGNILAAVEAGDKADCLVPREDEHADEFDVSGKLAQGAFHELFRSLWVDVETKELKHSKKPNSSNF